MDKKELKERETKVIELAVNFCNEKLDEECATLCTKLIQKLGRKRTNPLQSGRLEIWAAAAVYTICSINFIFSKDSRLSLTSNDICEYFGTSNSTTAQKSRTIKDLLKISQVFDPNFSLKEIAANNPLNRLRMSNGFSSSINVKRQGYITDIPCQQQCTMPKKWDNVPPFGHGALFVI